MSRWIHVAGAIRINDMRLLDGNKEKMIRAYLTAHLPDTNDGEWIFEVYENPEHSAIAAYDVVICADMRHYESPDSVIEWFKETHNLFKQKGGFPSIRQAVIHVDVEYGEQVVITADSEHMLVTEIPKLEEGVF